MVPADRDAADAHAYVERRCRRSARVTRDPPRHARVVSPSGRGRDRDPGSRRADGHGAHVRERDRQLSGNRRCRAVGGSVPHERVGRGRGRSRGGDRQAGDRQLIQRARTLRVMQSGGFAMKAASILAALLIVSGCASSSNTQNQLATKVQLELGQVGSFNNSYYFAGPVSIQYQLGIANNTGVPVTLRRLQLRTVNPGAYSLRTPTSTITANVPPGQSTVVNLSACGYTSGSELHAQE